MLWMRLVVVKQSFYEAKLLVHAGVMENCHFHWWRAMSASTCKYLAARAGMPDRWHWNDWSRMTKEEQLLIRKEALAMSQEALAIVARENDARA